MNTNNLISTSSFREKVYQWMLTCFGEKLSTDKNERNERFLEEALELVQSTGMSREQVHKLVDYVFNRPVGEPSQEVAGTMVSLAALCHAHDIDIDAAAHAEMERITTPQIMEKVRAKQKLKPHFYAEGSHLQEQSTVGGDGVASAS